MLISFLKGDDDYYYDYGIGPQKNYPAVDQIRQLPAVPLAPRALPQTASRMMPPKASRVMPEKGRKQNLNKSDTNYFKILFLYMYK